MVKREPKINVNHAKYLFNRKGVNKLFDLDCDETDNRIQAQSYKLCPKVIDLSGVKIWVARFLIQYGPF